MALAGRHTFAMFQDVIRLRRIHRILGKDPFKETTMRLRDAAITVEDYKLWKSHEVDTIGNNLTDPCQLPWPGAENLMRDAFGARNRQCTIRKNNAPRLCEGVPLLRARGSANAASVVVRCESTHNCPRAERPKADEFRNVRKALHLRVGARVMLVANHIWNINLSLIHI